MTANSSDNILELRHAYGAWHHPVGGPNCRYEHHCRILKSLVTLDWCIFDDLSPPPPPVLNDQWYHPLEHAPNQTITFCGNFHFCCTSPLLSASSRFTVHIQSFWALYMPSKLNIFSSENRNFTVSSFRKLCRTGDVLNSNSSSSCDTGFQFIELSLRLILKTRIKFELDLWTRIRAELETYRSSSSQLRAFYYT